MAEYINPRQKLSQVVEGTRKSVIWAWNARFSEEQVILSPSSS